MCIVLEIANNALLGQCKGVFDVAVLMRAFNKNGRIGREIDTLVAGSTHELQINSSRISSTEVDFHMKRGTTIDSSFPSGRVRPGTSVDPFRQNMTHRRQISI